MEEIRKKIKTCLEKEEAFCASVCPFHLDIREFIARMQRGAFNAAFRIYANTVGFPVIVAALCDQPCKEVCPRTKTDAPVSLNLLEKAAAAFAVNTKPNSYNMPTKEKKIAVIGAGISGLACALRLCNKKYRISVYEKTDRIGGQLWGLLDPKIFLADIENQFIYENYELHLNTNIDDPEALLKDFDAIYVATGRGGSDFGLLKNVDGIPFASRRQGIFLGGTLLGAGPMEAISHGLRAAGIIESYLKTGNMKSALPIMPTKMRLDPAALSFSAPVVPIDGEAYTKEEAVAEAKRCLRCQCDACFRHCEMMNYFEKFPKRINEEVEVTINPVTLDGNGTVATRLISTCNQCGLCGEVCPQGIDMGAFLRKAHQAMREKNAMPWVFHEFWLRDMAFSLSERAAFTALPKECEKSEYLFFPGCQLGASDPRYVIEAYRLLLKYKKDTALSLGCCGAPAVWAGDMSLYREVCEKIRLEWFKMGQPTAVFACPTCKQMFEESLPEIKGVLLYDLMAEFAIAPADNGQNAVVSVFDPCASRNLAESQQNIRKLVQTAGYRLEALPYEGKRAQCCSYGGQIAIANPPYTKWLVQKRTGEGKAPYVAYCANCRDIFADAGKPVRHILDIIFGINDWQRKPPTVSERMSNREDLKRSILKEFWPEKAREEVRMENKLKLVISSELAQKLNQERLLEEDIIDVIVSCEASGRKVLDAESGHCFGYKEIGHMTYWVEYLPAGDGYQLFDAYSHRMKIELEEMWHGRKQS